MYKYKNKKTGAVLETPCKISGGNWVEVTQKNSRKPNKDEKNVTGTGETNTKEGEDE